MSGAARWLVRGTVAVLIMILPAGAAFAQGIITVSKNRNPDADMGMFTSIQAAVNAAKPGNVIEILDTEVYEEQVTIDGREISPWAGVTGGKNGITIRYAPPVGTAPNSNFARPTIRYRDITNTSPKTMAEAQREGELPGSADNFETCGALRIIRASGVTIDGIAVDGFSAFPFGANGVWCPSGGLDCGDLFHGSAAITLVVAGNVTIRNCDLKNAYFGIYAKDRNTGGVFGNPNPNDNDMTIPLSGFGKTGNHLFEYNRVHNNSVGVFFESAWDLGSTVRYNLIYSNKHTTATSAAITIEKVSQNAGAFLFKDMFLTPVAIYNNTLYDNTANFLGNWQIGGQHLIFNNIFSKSTPASNPSPYMVIDGMFPNRMHSCVFSANTVRGSVINEYNCTANAAIAPGGFLAQGVQFEGFTNPAATPIQLTNCITNQGESMSAIRPGALIPGSSSTVTFPMAANIRWLQTEGVTYANGTNMPTLFKSVVQTSPDFLVPDWNHPQVIEFIKNKGWADVGIRNSDGSIADLGAIPSTGGQQKTVGRLKPSNVVLVYGGTSATASVFFTVEGGMFYNPKIKFLRWISPLPDNTDKWANDWTMIPMQSIRMITSPSTALSVGNNTFAFTLPAMTAAQWYGFFEMVVEGTDANGNTVTSDVGFLPYRRLDYILDIEVFPATGAMTAATKLSSVTAGENVRVRVTPRKIGDGAAFTNVLKEVDFQLLSDPSASMYYTADHMPLTTYKPGNAETVMIFPVFFAKAGNEVIQGAGLYESGANSLAFLGNSDIKVLPGAPAKVEFKNPIPLAQLGAAPAPIINRGIPQDVLVEVQDRFGNAVGRGITVTIAVDNPAIGDVAVQTVVTNDSGVAVNVARVTTGVPGQTFDMTATVTSGGVTANDVGRFRVGRVMDRLEVFYGDNQDGEYWWEYFDPDVGINGTFGDEKCYPVTVKAVSRDMVITSEGGSVKVYPEDGRMIFSATCGGASMTEFPMVGGVATFFVRVDPISGVEVVEGGISVELFASAGGPKDNGIIEGGRGNIRFTKLPRVVVSGRYIFTDGAVEYARLTFNGNVSSDWFSSMEFTFGAFSRTLTGASCISLAPGDPRTVLVDFGCAFPEETNIPDSMAGNSSIIITFSPSHEYDPITVNIVGGEVSILAHGRVIPNGKPGEVVVVAPVNQLTAEFTAGPNPVNKSSGAVNFFRSGVGIADGTLAIYDVTGNFVRKVNVSDKAVANSGRRKVGSWDLTDGKGRRVSVGTYLVRGTVTKKDGRKEKVSLILTLTY